MDLLSCNEVLIGMKLKKLQLVNLFSSTFRKLFQRQFRCISDFKLSSENFFLVERNNLAFLFVVSKMSCLLQFVVYKMNCLSWLLVLNYTSQWRIFNGRYQFLSAPQSRDRALSQSQVGLQLLK